MQQPIIVMGQSHASESGRTAQLSNITAGKTVADVIRTCLGPCAMLKMLLDPMSGIVITNDGNAILRECEASHPAAKSMIELARTQDEEVGDGTTSVIVLAGELLSTAAQFIERGIHTIIIISAYKKALEDALAVIERISRPVDTSNTEQMSALVKATIGTKMISRWSGLMCRLAIDAVRTVVLRVGERTEVDVKRYVRIEKIPGGEIDECCVLDGVMVNKDVTHPKMRRHIVKPRILLLDCPLEYKKGESQTNIEITREEDWSKFLEIEEEQVREICQHIAAHKPDIVFTEKGVSDLAQHHLLKAGITAIRRLRKTDNNRIARATGATIVNRVKDIKEEDIGTGCGEFKVEKIGDEYFTYLVGCHEPKACTVVLRGPNKDVLNEIERNLADAMCVARNVYFNPRLAPGGGATEMAISVELAKRSKAVSGVEQWPYRAVADALEVIPRTLVQNCGGNAIKTLTNLRAKHAESPAGATYGIDGITGNVVDMTEFGVWEPCAVKVQTLKTAIEAACMLLRVDDIVSGSSKNKQQSQSASDMAAGPEYDG